MRFPSGPAAVLVVVVAAFGCDGIGYDLDTVPLRTLDVRTDASPTDGGQRDTDATDTSIDGVGDMPRTVDAGDVGAVDASDMGNVRACANAFPLAEDAPCNPTQTGECPEDGICTLAVVTTPPPELACLPRSQEGDAGPGEACGRPSDCAENLACVDWSLNEPDPRGKICTRYCELETGFGCEEGEFCTKADPQPPVEGIGWCTPTCDPYDPEACPVGQTCSIDYNYPTGTCLPRFRCVQTSDFQMEGEACGPGAEVTRCVSGLTCYEVEVALFECVRPCRADADCDSGSCGEPAGDWGLRYCQ